MGFLGVYTTIYDYEPRAEGELAIAEGDVLYVLEKGEDDGWWKAKKKAGVEDEDEPVGLVPNNYVEEVGSAKSISTRVRRSHANNSWYFRLRLSAMPALFTNIPARQMKNFLFLKKPYCKCSTRPTLTGYLLVLTASMGSFHQTTLRCKKAQPKTLQACLRHPHCQ